MDFTAAMIELDIPAAPPSVNRIWRNGQGKTYLSKEAVEFYQIVKWTVRERVPKDWRYYRVEIVVEPRSRRGDVDNKIKPTLDALTKAGFWPDDDRVAFVSCHFGKVNRNGRTLIRVSRMDKKYF